MQESLDSDKYISIVELTKYVGRNSIVTLPITESIPTNLNITGFKYIVYSSIVMIHVNIKLNNFGFLWLTETQ